MAKFFEHQYIQRIHVQRFGGVVDIEIYGGLTNEIAGPCAAGKTSLLRAVQAALGGIRAHAKTVKGAPLAARSDHPIRRGETDADVEVETDDFIIRLVLEEGQPPHLKIKGKHGGTFNRSDVAQWLNVLTFDPTEFASWPEQRQFDVFRGLAGETWCERADEIEGNELRAMDERTRLAKEMKALGEVPPPPEIPPEPEGGNEEPPDTAALMKELEEAQEFNRTQGKAEEAIVVLNGGKSMRLDAIRSLEEKLAAARKELAGIEEALSNATQPKPLIDTAPIQQKIANASEISKAISARNNEWQAWEHAKTYAMRKWEEAKTVRETTAEAFKAAETKVLTVRQERTRHMEAARLPVQGVTFERGKVLVNGLPLTELSGGEMIDLCADVMFAMNPEFRVMFVQRGEQLDQAMFDRLLAKANSVKPPLQLWIATVSDMPENEGDKVGHGDAILIYEGRVVERGV